MRAVVESLGCACLEVSEKVNQVVAVAVSGELVVHRNRNLGVRMSWRGERRRCVAFRDRRLA